MKKRFLIAVILAFFATEASAANPQESQIILAQIEDGYTTVPPLSHGNKTPRTGKVNVPQSNQSQFINQPFFTIEYSAPRLSHNNKENDFRTNNFGKQLRNVENIALGVNLRVHKFFGANANWAQTELKGDNMPGSAPTEQSRFALDQYNFSGLAYLPVIEDKFDIFAELGTSLMFSKLNYTDPNQNLIHRHSSRAVMFYGAGFQFTPFAESKNTIRVSYQKYSGHLLTGNEYSTIRAGYLVAF
jgi:opacity protein-like surface antigen